MTDEKPCKCDLLQKAQAAGILIGALAAAYAGYVGHGNSRKIENVEAGQQAAVAVADDVKAKLDISSEKQEKTLNKVQKATEAVEDSLGPQLWRTWKNLEDDAAYAKTHLTASEAKAFETKAAEAKAKFEAHMARQRLPKN